MKLHVLKSISIKAVQLDIGVTWDHKISSFDTDLANALLNYLIPEDDTSDNFGRLFWRYSLFFNVLKACLLRVVCKPEMQS